jgi:hypothetical protein
MIKFTISVVILLLIYIYLYIYVIRESSFISKIEYICAPCKDKYWILCDWEGIDQNGKHVCYNIHNPIKYINATEVDYYDIENEFFVIVIIVLLWLFNCFCIHEFFTHKNELKEPLIHDVSSII